MELLFAAPKVDRFWLEQFRAGLAADSGWVARCVTAVEERYAVDPNARNGFSRLAWGLTQIGRGAEAFEYQERDWALGRMERWMFVRHLEALIARGAIALAEERVTAFLLRQPAANDCWATLGQYFARQKDDARARAYFAREPQPERVSGVLLLNLADVEARAGRWSEAEALVAAAYARAPEARNGYARLGLPKRAAGEYQDAIRYVEHDLELDRLTPPWLIDLAELNARLGQWSEATTLVERAYAWSDATRVSHSPIAEGDLQDGFARLARIPAQSNKWSDVRALLRRDLQARRISFASLTWLGEAEVRCGDWDAPYALMAEAYRQDEKLRDGCAQIGLRIEKRYFQRARLLFRADWAAGRLTPLMIVHLATMEGWLGHERVAEDLVAAAYAADASLRDGYAGLARLRWQWGERSEAARLAQMDRDLGRLTEEARKELAVLQAAPREPA